MTDVIITHLEMLEAPSGEPLKAPADVQVLCPENVAPNFYRNLYSLVGGDWSWTDRLPWTDEKLNEVLHHPAVDIHVLSRDQRLAGYSELDGREWPDLQLAYFGLAPEFIGQGLGRFFLDWTVHKAWERKPARLIVNTCTLDHPRALDTYKKAGFQVYKTERRAK